MNTHILIPIKDIEKEYKYSMLVEKVDFLKEFISKYKQISLDEKNIEEKLRYEFEDAPIEYNNAEASAWVLGKNFGYKQALKDLI